MLGSVIGVWLFGAAAPAGPDRPRRSRSPTCCSSAPSACSMLVESVRAWFRMRTRRDTLHQAAPAPLAARAAAQAPVPQLAPLHQRADAARPRRLRRHPGRDHGGRRRLPDGAGDDLSARHADPDGGRHVAVPDQLRHCGHDLSARGQQPDGRRGAGAGADRRRGDRRPVRVERRRPAARRAAAHPARADRARGLRQARLRPDRRRPRTCTRSARSGLSDMPRAPPRPACSCASRWPRPCRPAMRPARRPWSPTCRTT